MDFSLIIPVRNRPDELRRCLQSITGGTSPAARYEIIVVDNGSTDKTPAVARELGARLIYEPQPNRCLARNAGAAAAAGDWLVFLDSDCVAEPCWLQSLASKITDSPDAPPAIIAGAILPAEPATLVEAYIAQRRWIDQEKFLAPGRRYSPPFAATANLAIHRDVFQQVGGFDPQLKTAGEDADWCWRAAQAGWRIEYCPQAAVTHHHRATLAGLWRQAYHYGQGNADLFAKWHEQWQADRWIESCHYLWSIKGFLKFPCTLPLARTPLQRYEPLFDGLANLAMALGRARGGLRHRRWVL